VGERVGPVGLEPTTRGLKEGARTIPRRPDARYEGPFWPANSLNPDRSRRVNWCA
jgi:hypothetical protein